MSAASLGLRTLNTTVSNAAWELRASSGVIARILEIALLQQAATASSYGIGRPAAIGATPGNVGTFQRDNSNDPPCVTTAALSWNVSPTAPTNYLRRWNATNVAGVAMIFTFPRGLAVPAGGSMVVFNITASALLDVDCIIDE